MPKFERVAAEYAQLWGCLEIKPERLHAVTAIARRIIDGRLRYGEVSAVTGVPWFIVGVLHAMECSRFPEFSQHLHNGDPLTARTRQVPRGRPLAGKPPFAWAASATDAIRYDNLDKVERWTVERAAYALEGYNGWGYRPRGVPSPYLWSYSNHYDRGKYIADGRWSASAVSDQPGALVILKRLGELCPDAVLPREGVEVASPKATPSVRETVRTSGTIYGAAVKAAGYVAFALAWLCENADDMADAGEHAQSVAERILHLTGVSLPWIGTAAAVFGFVLILQRRTSATTEHRVG